MKEVLRKLQLPVIAVFFIPLVGCATTLNISPTFKEIENPPIIQKINSKVGVSIPEHVRSYIYSLPGSGGFLKVAFGESSRSRFLEVSNWLFVDPVEISEKRPGSIVKIQLDGFIELEFLSLEVSERHIDVNYIICLYNSQRTVINRWIASQRVPYWGVNLIPLIEKAVRGVFAKFIVAFMQDPLVQKWASYPSKQSLNQVIISSDLTAPQSAKQLGLLVLLTKEKTEIPLAEYEDYIIKGIFEECPINNIIQSQKIMDILYPFVEQETAPDTENGLISLLLQKDINKRLINHGIRYLALVSGATHQDDIHGDLAGGLGILGFVWEDEKTQLDVIILDLQQLEQGERLKTSAEDTSWVVGLAFPLWHSAQTEKKASKELGIAIGKHLRDYDNLICK